MTDKQVSKIEEIIENTISERLNGGHWDAARLASIIRPLKEKLKTAIESFGAEKLKEGFEAGREGLEVEGVRYDGTYCEVDHPASVETKISYKYQSLNDYLNRGKE